MKKPKIVVSDLRAAVEIELSAKLPMLQRELVLGVEAAMSKIKFRRIAEDCAYEVLTEMMAEATREEIRKVVEKASRDTIKTATADVIEMYFKRWLVEDSKIQDAGEMTG